MTIAAERKNERRSFAEIQRNFLRTCRGCATSSACASDCAGVLREARYAAYSPGAASTSVAHIVRIAEPVARASTTAGVLHQDAALQQFTDIAKGRVRRTLRHLLHVSGHARRGELREMLQLVRPEFFIPVHAGTLRRSYHADLEVEEGIPRKNIMLPDNGDCIYFTLNTVEHGGQVPHGSLLVDQNGAIVSGLVVKDRLMLCEEGIMAVILTIDKKSGKHLCSPDIISRGFIAMKDNDDLMNLFRTELRHAVAHRYKRIDLDRFKAKMRDYITHFMYEKTGHSPIVIPVVNIIGGKVDAKTAHTDKTITSDERANKEQQRFAELRARLLGQDQRD